MDHDKGAFIRGQLRVSVVVADEGHPLDAAAEAGLVDLRLAATIRGEVDGLAVLAPEGLGIDGRTISHAAHLTAAHVHHVDLRIAVARQHEGQAIAVRRPGRGTVEALEVGDLLAATGVDVLDEDARTLLLE
ncbi:hypothetical protein D3C75_927000 [compost metagenome]